VAYALFLFLIIISITIAYGFQWLTQAGLFPSILLWSQLWSGIFLLLVVVVGWWALSRKGDTAELDRKHAWLGVGLMSASFMLTLYLKSDVIAPVPWSIAAVLSVSVALVSFRLWGVRGAISAFQILGIALIVMIIWYNPWPSNGDMLITVEAAARELLAGKQPYRAYPEIYDYYTPGWDTTNRDTALQYLPGLWLPYLPAVAMGIDLRIFNTILLILLLWVFEKGLPARDKDRATILALAVYPLLLSNSFFNAINAVHTWPFWLFIGILAVLLVRYRYFWAAIMFGIVLATRQSALFFVFPLSAILVNLVGVVAFLRYATVSLGVFLVLTLPFALWWGEDFMFWRHLYLRFTSLGEDMFLVVQAPISMGTHLGYNGLAGALTWIQLVLLFAATGMILVRRMVTPTITLGLMGMVFILVASFSPYVVRYVYYPGLILIAIAAVVWRIDGEEQKSKSAD
jgi:uncharacterized membrane protein